MRRTQAGVKCLSRQAGCLACRWSRSEDGTTVVVQSPRVNVSLIVPRSDHVAILVCPVLRFTVRWSPSWLHVGTARRQNESGGDCGGGTRRNCPRPRGWHGAWHEWHGPRVADRAISGRLVWRHHRRSRDCCPRARRVVAAPTVDARHDLPSRSNKRLQSENRATVGALPSNRVLRNPVFFERIGAVVELVG